MRAVQSLAALRPVARTPPDVLSLAGVVVLGGAVAVAAVLPGPAGPACAALLVLLGGLLDGLDGAVALRSGRARPLGAVVDGVADRVGDLLLVAVLAVLGAPLGWCIATAVLTSLHEYLRARAQSVGMPGVGSVTVAERPTRVIVVLVAAVGQAVAPGGAPVTGWGWATSCAVLGTVIGVLGTAQLARAVTRAVPPSFADPPDR